MIPLCPNDVYLLIPIASVGCGKSTIGSCLTELYSWPHVFTDDQFAAPRIWVKKLIDVVMRRLEAYVPGPIVVYGKRNNHLPEERSFIVNTLISQIGPYVQSLRIIALHFDHSPTMVKQLHAVASRRVCRSFFSSMVVSSPLQQTIFRTMKTIQSSFDALNIDKNFDYVILLSVASKDSSLTNLHAIISALAEKYPDALPFVPSFSELQVVFQSVIRLSDTL